MSSLLLRRWWLTYGNNYDHELPEVYGVPTDIDDEFQPIEYWYFKGIGFDEWEFDGVNKTESLYLIKKPSKNIHTRQPIMSG